MSITPKTENTILFLNRISMVLIVLIGLSLVAIASFRADSQTLVLHSIGAVPLFFCGPFLCIIQSWISFKLIPYVNFKSMAYYRLFLAIGALISEIGFSSFTVWSYFLFTKDWKKDRLKWKSSDGGFVQHVIGSAFEWIYLFIVSFFVFTFSQEFKRFKLKEDLIFVFLID